MGRGAVEVTQSRKTSRRHPERYFVDLFAGCGGLSLGLEQAGFAPVFVSELNQDALDTYLVNRESRHPHLLDEDLHCNDVTNLLQDDYVERLHTTFPHDKLIVVVVRKGSKNLLNSMIPVNNTPRYAGIQDKSSLFYDVDYPLIR